MRSGSCSATAASAAVPLSAVTVSKPSKRSAEDTRWVTFSSSSTTRTRRLAGAATVDTDMRFPFERHQLRRTDVGRRLAVLILCVAAVRQVDTTCDEIKYPSAAASGGSAHDRAGGPQRVLDLADRQLAEVEHAGRQHRVGAGRDRRREVRHRARRRRWRSPARRPPRAPPRSARRSKPSLVPSASIEFSRISPAPELGRLARPTRPRRCRCRAGRRAWSPRSRTAARLPSARRASTDSTSTCEPNRSAISASSSGRAIAAVLTPDLVGAGPQQPVDVVDRAHAAADGQRDEHLLGGAAHHVVRRLAGRRCDAVMSRKVSSSAPSAS